MNPIQYFLLAVALYALVGFFFAIAFVFSGVKRIDPVAQDAPLRVRLLFLPGAAALWPLLAVKWARGSGDAP